MKSIAEFTNTFESMESAGAEQARRADYNREWALRAERERDAARERADTMFAKHAEILDQYRRERDAERALADRLASRLSYHAEVDGEYAPDTTLAALAAWKKARNEI